MPADLLAKLKKGDNGKEQIGQWEALHRVILKVITIELH